MKAQSLMNALTDQVEKLKTHQNNHMQPMKAEPKKPHKVRRMVQHNEIHQGKVVTA